MKKIAIIGGGVVGLSSAYYLSGLGYQVTVVSDDDKNAGCSYGNAGMIVPSHFIPLAAPGMVMMGLKWLLKPDSPFYIKPRFNKDLMSWGWKFYKAATPAHVQRAMHVLKEMNMVSRSLYLQLAEQESLDFSLQTKGLFMLCKTRHALKEESAVAAHARQLGMKAETLSGEELMSMDKGVEMDVEGGVYFPMDACFVPGLFMTGMRSLLEKRGVSFVSERVTGFDMRGSRMTTVQTSNNLIRADEFIVAAGAWSSELLKTLKVNIPMQGGKGYSIMVEQPAVYPGICALLSEARVSVTPMNGAVRFGGTMELNGIDRTVNRKRVGGIYKSIPSYYPQFESTNFLKSDVWVGLRPCSPDGLPYVGKFKHYDNLIAATGHSMMGMSLGPVTGKLVAQIVSGQKPDIDIALLNPDRYN